VIIGSDATADFKSPTRNSRSSVHGNLRRGRTQSRRLVLDVRSVGMSEQDAVENLRRALGAYGGGYDEVLVLGREFGLLWP
jgi:hypothetical protein